MIKCTKEIIVKSQTEFHKIDEIITGFAFDAQNELGRFCNEIIYQKIIEQKCNEASIKVDSEMEVSLIHKDFVKIYKLDLVVDNGVIYELKTVNQLNNFHKQQLINYLLITKLNHGKLINFRSPLVKCEFVSTGLTDKNRYKYFVNIDDWQEITDKCSLLKSVLLELLSDWGAFLESQLYNEALIYFLGGESKIVVPVEIFYHNKIVGKQKMCLLNTETIFHLSTISKSFKVYEENIRNLIKHTNIKVVQWINIFQHEIIFKTIIKSTK